MSIRGDLLKRLIVPLLIVNMLGAGLTYWLAWIPTQIAFDQGLADAGWALIPRLHTSGGQIKIDLSKQAEQVLRMDHFDTIYFVVRNEERKTIAGDKDFPPLNHPSQLNAPLPYDGAIRGEPVRIISFQAQIGDAPIFIGVAETLRKRTDARARIFEAFLLLEGLLSIISIVISWRAVTNGLLPLRKMQVNLSARNHDDLSPVENGSMPVELRPVAAAINGLLEKAQMEASAQQNFLANVAHQLRTPLAGLKTQLEWLKQKHLSENETVRSADLMLSSTERMIRQTNQLLALARAEPSRFEKTRLEPVELDKLIEESVQYFVQEADKKNIDLGFDLHPTRIMGDHFLLRDLIDNLIDNAIRYSPPESAVTVSCNHDGKIGMLAIEDSGPGIPDSHRELVFNRYYRIDGSTQGSGLGLAIVRDIVKDHGAEIVLQSGHERNGTNFSIRFPA
jgi:two-component system, OmpR family, sensor histidine kinase TctE